MKIGCMVWRISGLELDFWEQIDWIKEQGFQEVSFHTCTFLGDGKGIEPEPTNKVIVDRLKKALAEFKEVDIHAPFDNYDLCLVSPNPLIRKASIETLKKSILFAEKLHASVVTLHAGDSGASMNKNVWRKNLKESLIELNRITNRLNVNLGIELTDGYQLLEEIDSKNIGITIDTGHLSFNDGAGYKEFGTIGGVIKRFAKKIFHLHIHDYDGKYDHLALGKGGIDFREIIDSLKMIHYTGSLCLELNPERNTAKNLLTSRDFLRNLIL